MTMISGIVLLCLLSGYIRLCFYIHKKRTGRDYYGSTTWVDKLIK